MNSLLAITVLAAPIVAGTPAEWLASMAQEERCALASKVLELARAEGHLYFDSRFSDVTQQEGRALVQAVVETAPGERHGFVADGACRHERYVISGPIASLEGSARRVFQVLLRPTRTRTFEFVGSLVNVPAKGEPAGNVFGPEAFGTVRQVGSGWAVEQAPFRFDPEGGIGSKKRKAKK